MSFSKLAKPHKPLLRWERIKLLIFDCDGVLTDGRIIYDSAGNESKNFDARDGMGFLLLRQTDIQTAVITGRNSSVLQRRCDDLKINHLFQGIQNKLEKATELLRELNLTFDNLLVMGDDWNDVPLMFKAAVSVCPGDAPESVKELCEIVTRNHGGRGAVRECIELVLNQQRKLEPALLKYVEQIS